MQSFYKCKKDDRGLVDTRDYYTQLCKDIKGFEPRDYGGRFNVFYKNMGVFDIIVESNDYKFLKLKEQKS